MFAIFKRTDKAWFCLSANLHNNAFLTVDTEVLSDNVLKNTDEFQFKEVEESKVLEKLIEAMKNLDHEDRSKMKSDMPAADESKQKFLNKLQSSLKATFFP